MRFFSTGSKSTIARYETLRCSVGRRDGFA